MAAISYLLCKVPETISCCKHYGLAPANCRVPPGPGGKGRLQTPSLGDDIYTDGTLTRHPFLPSFGHCQSVARGWAASLSIRICSHTQEERSLAPGTPPARQTCTLLSLPTPQPVGVYPGNPQSQEALVVQYRSPFEGVKSGEELPHCSENGFTQSSPMKKTEANKASF